MEKGLEKIRGILVVAIQLLDDRTVTKIFIQMKKNLPGLMSKAKRIVDGDFSDLKKL